MTGTILVVLISILSELCQYFFSSNSGIVLPFVLSHIRIVSIMIVIFVVHMSDLLITSNKIVIIVIILILILVPSIGAIRGLHFAVIISVLSQNTNNFVLCYIVEWWTLTVSGHLLL